MKFGLPELRDVMEQMPLVTITGLERRSKPGTSDRRAALLADVEAFAHCCEWLRACEWLRTPNTNYDSRGLATQISLQVDHKISNGALVAAVIQLGIPFRPAGRGPNIYIAIPGKYRYGKVQPTMLANE